MSVDEAPATPRRTRFARGFVRAGVAMQLVLLALVDAGTIAGFRSRELGLPWWVMLAAVNVALVAIVVILFRWSRGVESSSAAGVPR